MAVQFGSIASGLPQGLVEKLVELERAPIKKLEARKSDYSLQLELLRDLKDKLNKIGTNLSSMGDYRSFTDLKPVSSDPSVLDAVVDKNIAEPGLYRLEVLSLAERASAMSNGFPDRNDSQVGVGYFTVEMPNGDSRTIYIDSTHNTLDGMASLINEGDLGLKARVINDGSGSDNPWRLAVNGLESGKDGKLEFPTFYFLDGDQEFYMDKFTTATTARVKVDGFEVEFDDNTLKDFIPGVTVDLKKAVPGQVITLKITKDAEKIAGKVKDTIDHINSVLSFINQQNQLDENTNTRQTLGGDSMLRTLESRLRTVIQKVIPATTEKMSSLRASDLGIQFQRTGLLAFDEKRFVTALERDFESAANVFVGDRKAVGLVPELRTVVQVSNDRGEGMLTHREEGIMSRIRRIDTDIDNAERTATRRGENIRKKFAALETAVSRLKGQGNAVSALGAAANASGGGMNFGGASLT